MRQTDNRNLAHGLITSARLDEISLTNDPASPAAKIALRYPDFNGAFYDTARRGFEKIREIVELLAQLQAQARTAPEPARRITTPIAPPQRAMIAARPPTEFQRLVQEINR